MHAKLLTSALLLALAVLLAQPLESQAFRWWQRRGGQSRRMEVTCSQVKPQEICDGTNSQFQVADGCNMCVCGSQAGKLTCSIKSCPREDELTDEKAKRKAAKFCAKLVKKVQKRLRKFQKAKLSSKASSSSSSGSQQTWPIKCFKERKLCRAEPGVAFFDGCNRCRCPEQPGPTAQCEAANVCPDFVGTRKEFKRRCRALGARIEGADAGKASGKGGRKRGGRGRRPEPEAEEARSLMKRLLSIF